MAAKRPKRDTRVADQEEPGRGHVTDIQRARMIAAIIDAVSERGRASATVAHVVSRSGVSRRTFYDVFNDFEDCFLAALEHSISSVSEYVLGAYDPAETWQTRIRAGMIAVLEFLEDEPAMGRLCIVETLGAGPKVDERRQQVLDALIAKVDQGRSQAKAPAALTGECLVGGVLSVLYTRLIAHDRGKADERRGSLLELTGSLMSMIVLPYLGPAVAQKESSRAAPQPQTRTRAPSGDPLRDLQMRLTYRTVRVLMSIAVSPGASNRDIGMAAGIDDQGQISKLLSRMERLGLVHNSGAGQVSGAANAWALTAKGVEVQQLVDAGTSAGQLS
ncbi:MAG TPA: hypothetical protein VID48_15505 [Solirubrobacteraceae bacterium]|jgi:AcrR family transcriptional regulator